MLTDRDSDNSIKTSGFNFTHYVKIKVKTHKACTHTSFLGVNIIIKGAHWVWLSPSCNIIVFTLLPSNIPMGRGSTAHTHAYHCQVFPSPATWVFTFLWWQGWLELAHFWTNQSHPPLVSEEALVSVTFLPCFLEIHSSTRRYHSLPYWMSHL